MQHNHIDPREAWATVLSMTTESSMALADSSSGPGSGGAQSMTESALSDRPRCSAATRGEDSIDVDANVINGRKQQALVPCLANYYFANSTPIPGSLLVNAQRCSKSLWGETAKLTVKLPDEALKDYFLKV